VKNEIDNQIVLAQAPEGPIAGYIVSFAKSLSEQGYTRRSIYRQVLLAAFFSRWLKQKGGLPARLPRFLADHAPLQPRRQAKNALHYVFRDITIRLHPSPRELG
jgi:hypothetical protein